LRNLLLSSANLTNECRFLEFTKEKKEGIIVFYSYYAQRTHDKQSETGLQNNVDWIIVTTCSRSELVL
jgi:hypothetical protein